MTNNNTSPCTAEKKTLDGKRVGGREYGKKKQEKTKWY